MKQLFIFTLGLLLLISCGKKEAATLRVMTHDSFDISEEVITAFTEETGIKVEIFKAGDGGQMLSQAILSKDTPQADVMYGIDNTFLGRALSHNLFTPYTSPLVDNLRPDLVLDAQHRVLPVDYGDVCLNYDKAWFEASPLSPPASLEQLIDPAYAGLTVVENPATSTPGLAFLLTTVSQFGDDGYLDFWRSLRDNDVAVANGWEDAYWGQFSAASDGDRPIVVSYASSPVAEVVFAEEPPSTPPVAAVVSNGTCFRQIEFVGILKGTENEEAAQEWIDFMLSTPFQEDIPLHMFVYPANADAVLPDVFIQHSVTPDQPAELDSAEIAANRDNWIDAWTNVVIRGQ